MTPKEFSEFVYKDLDEDYGICPPPIDPQVGLDILIEHFLGDDWYSAMPLGATQINTEAIFEILHRYPRKVPLIKRIINKIKFNKKK